MFNMASVLPEDMRGVYAEIPKGFGDYTLHGHKLRLYVDIGSAICDRGHYKNKIKNPRAFEIRGTFL